MKTTAQLITAGEAAVVDGKWSLAASQFEAAYQQEQSYALNLKLVTALRQTKKFTQASELALEYEADYLKTDQTADVLIDCLCQSQQFIQARLSAQQRATTAPMWLQATKKQLSAAEQLAETMTQRTLKTTMKQFYHLSDLPVTAQMTRLAAAKHLTYAKYLTAAKFLLVDPFLHQLSRVEVLYTLKGLGVESSVTFQWLDETSLTVVPNALPAMGQDRVSLAVQAALQQQLAHQDVVLYESLQGLLSLQLMYLYPSPEKIVTNAQSWVELLIGSQTGQLSPKLTVFEQKMLDTQQKIQQLNLELAQ